MIDIWLTMKYGGATYFAQPDALKVTVLCLFFFINLLYQKEFVTGELGFLKSFISVPCQGSLANTLREVRPTAFMGVPRVWEKMQEKMKAVGAKSSTIKRKVATWAKGVGLETNLKRMSG